MAKIFVLSKKELGILFFKNETLGWLNYCQVPGGNYCRDFVVLSQKEKLTSNK